MKAEIQTDFRKRTAYDAELEIEIMPKEEK